MLRPRTHASAGVACCIALILRCLRPAGCTTPPVPRINMHRDFPPCRTHLVRFRRGPGQGVTDERHVNAEHGQAAKHCHIGDNLEAARGFTMYRVYMWGEAGCAVGRHAPLPYLAVVGDKM